MSHTTISRLIFACVLLCFTNPVLATNPPTVNLEKAVHFVTPSGDDVVVGPGVFVVEVAEEWLRFIPKDGGRADAILVQAGIAQHGESITAPMAKSQTVAEDQHLVALLLPDGTTLEAEGSYSGVRSRGRFGFNKNRFSFQKKRSRSIAQSQRRRESRQQIPTPRPQISGGTTSTASAVGASGSPGTQTSTGSPRVGKHITRVNMTSTGMQGDLGSSGAAAISSDGRFIAFSTRDALLPADMNNWEDVYLKDRKTGKLTWVSVTSTGEPKYNEPGPSQTCGISADGRIIAFTSPFDLGSGDLSPKPGKGWTIFIQDRQAGDIKEVGQMRLYGLLEAPPCALSGNGRYIAFVSELPLVPEDTNASLDTFVYDRQTGETRRVSLNSSGEEGRGGMRSDDSAELGFGRYGTPPKWKPAINHDGRYVAFRAFSSNLVPNDTNNSDVFVHDLQTGQTTLVSISSSGKQGAWAFAPAISANGRYIFFLSSSDLVGQNRGSTNVFRHDRLTGQTRTVSLGHDGKLIEASVKQFSISVSGSFVAFSTGGVVVPGDNNLTTDIFLRDTRLRRTSRISVGQNGELGNKSSGSPSLNGDGRFIVFSSSADNFVPNDTNGKSDIFVRQNF